MYTDFFQGILSIPQQVVYSFITALQPKLTHSIRIRIITARGRFYASVFIELLFLNYPIYFKDVSDNLSGRG